MSKYRDNPISKATRLKALLLLILLPILIFGVFYIPQNKKIGAIKENPDSTYAVIYNLYIEEKSIKNRSHSERNIYYKYIVNGVEYKGIQTWHVSKDHFCIGDTITIFYDKKNPANVYRRIGRFGLHYVVGHKNL
jgi:hypothetical protein